MMVVRLVMGLIEGEVGEEIKRLENDGGDEEARG